MTEDHIAVARAAAALEVTKGVLKSVRTANLRLRLQVLDEPTYCGLCRLTRELQRVTASAEC
jgi:hypothetical protein